MCTKMCTEHFYSRYFLRSLNIRCWFASNVNWFFSWSVVDWSASISPATASILTSRMVFKLAACPPPWFRILLEVPICGNAFGVREKLLSGPVWIGLSNHASNSGWPSMFSLKNSFSLSNLVNLHWNFIFSDILWKFVKSLAQDVVLLIMTDHERNIITSVWNEMVLRKRLEDDPYSLTQDELTSLQNNDRLNERINSMVWDSLVQKAVLNNFKNGMKA